MTISTTWSVSNMTRNEADGGVVTVYYSCVATDGTFSATEGGKLRCEPDASGDSFISYDSLTEADVLGWVYTSLTEGEETADEAKARIETNRTGKVQGQIDRASAQADGTPWAA